MSEPSSAQAPHRPGQMTGVKVFVKGLKLEAEIGVYAHEHGIRQPLIADVEMDIIAAGWERLAETVNYEVIAEKARRTAAEGHFQLVEAFAERLARACLADQRVTQARVRVEKPLALAPDAVGAGVEITLTRN